MTTDYRTFPRSEVRRGRLNEKEPASSRLAYPANESILERILALRREIANIMGHPTWASYNAEDKMVKNAKTIESFIQDLAKVVTPAARKEIKSLLKQKKKDNRRAKRIEVWDRFYYVGQVREEKYSFDAQSVRPYFPYTRVTEGIFDLYGELFGVRFEKMPMAPVWHEAVEAYGMYDLEGDTLLGQFYLDMHPREGSTSTRRCSHRTGLEDGRMPMGALVCNSDRMRTAGAHGA